ncbi:MAG: heme-binding protein [Woeseiaceae bacterium]|nr:heme-binding protein [Woeseiaceae bacterium]
MTRALASLILATIIAAAGAPAMALEEPQFEVIHVTNDYEIRHYAPYIVAEVDVTGDMGDSGNRAFRILADYIFGNNEPGQKMQMTAPVVSDAPQPARDAYTYAFVMESRYSMDTLPAPVDPRIRIVQKPAQVVAARSYSGRWTQENFLQHEVSLVSALTIDGLSTRSEPLLARYDSPFKPWFLRRNEVLVELDWELN